MRHTKILFHISALVGLMLVAVGSWAAESDLPVQPDPALEPWWQHPWALGVAVVLLALLGVQTGRVVRRDRRLREANRALSGANEELSGLTREIQASDRALQRERAVERTQALVQSMEQASDFEEVLSMLTEDLKAVGLSFDICGIDLLDEPVDEPTMAYLEQHGFRYTTYTIGREGSVTHASHHLSAPFSDGIQETIERFLAGRPWQADPGGAEAIVEVPIARYGLLRITTSDRQVFTEEEIGALQDFAAAIALGYARFLDFQRLEEQNRALEEANRQVQEANRLKSQFLANMSHELRTPLNAILGFTQLMSREPGFTPKQQENLEVIGRSGEHLLGLINDVLDMSKIEAGKTVLNEGDFDLYGLLDNLEEMLRFRAEDKGLQLAFERAAELPRYVRTDESKLRQVLINLLGNAIKFTEAGAVTLRGGYRGEENRLLFEVEDAGPGIAPEEMEVLFDAFVQTSSGQQAQEGTGLGLPISQEYVRLMGGEITVRSEVGEGSTFRFDIRVGLAEAADIREGQPDRRVVGLAPNQPVYRILTVEDRWENRKLLVNLLEPLGFEVQEAENGREGVEVWKAWQPHLIWMDIRMPVMDGYEAARRIKAMPKGQDTVIIALTASVFDEDRAKVLSAGCDGFMRKPFREAEVFEAMAAHLGVRYVYEDQDRRVPDRSEAGVQEALGPDALAMLPADWVGRLHRAATQLDGEVISGLLEQIEGEHAGLARALGDLVHEFQFDKIVALTRPEA